MKNEPNGHFRVSVHKQGDTAVSRLCDRRLSQTPAAPACALGLLLISFCGVAGAQGNSPTQLRQFIDQQVGGLNKLKVPATDAEIPVPRMPDGTVNPRYQTTEAKRFLGKMLFHDPIRTARININKGQPLDLPAGTAFGGTVSASEPNIQEIVNAQRQDTSCGSCHLGEAAGKAGQLLNFAVGGEGRGYTDEHGNFIPRRRPLSILTKLRTAPHLPRRCAGRCAPDACGHLLRRRPASRHYAGPLLPFAAGRRTARRPAGSMSWTASGARHHP